MIDTTNENELAIFEEKQVRQHNAITSGRYDFTACQLDIIFMLLGLLKQGEDTYTVFVKDIEQITGRKWNYAQLRKATEDMGCRMFEIETEKSYKQLWLFQMVEYLKGEGAFRVSISPKALPYFFDLKNNYTYLHLKSVLCFSSKYAKRLYAIACQWRTKKHKIYEIKEFKKMSDITFDYKLIKKGRSFRYIEILVNTREQMQLQIDFNDIARQKFITRLKNSGFNDNEVEQISQKLKPQAYDELIDMLNKQKIEVKKSPLAYLRGVLKKKGILG